MPTCLTFSQDGLQFVTMSFPDRYVRVFKFLSGKMYRKYDESIPIISEMQQVNRNERYAAPGGSPGWWLFHVGWHSHLQAGWYGVWSTVSGRPRVGEITASQLCKRWYVDAYLRRGSIFLLIQKIQCLMKAATFVFMRPFWVSKVSSRTHNVMAEKETDVFWGVI